MHFIFFKFPFFLSNIKNPITEKSTYCDDTKLSCQNNVLKNQYFMIKNTIKIK